MRLGQLTNMERGKIEDEIAALLAKIKEFEELLGSHHLLLEVVKKEALALRNKYADPRRTEICHVSGEVDIEDLIPQEDCVVTMTRYGYIKRIEQSEYSTQNRGGRGVKGMSTREEDVATTMFICNSHSYILFFTDKGRVYRVKCYTIPEGTRQSKGMNIANILPIATDEKVTSMIPVKEFEEDKYLIMITKYGIIKRIALDAYNTARKGGLIALDLNEGDELRFVKMTEGNEDIIVATRDGMSIRFKETDVRPMGRQARGVKAMNLREGDTIVGMSVIKEGKLIITVSETGYGRLSSPDNYRIQTRGGKGLTNYHTEKYGKVAGINVIDQGDDIILISEEGVVIRIQAKDVRICARPSKGVTLMRINEGNRVVSFAHLPHDDEESSSKPEDNGSEEEVTTENE